MMDANHKKNVLKTCSQTSTDAKAIYKTVNYKKQACKCKNIVCYPKTNF